MAPKKKIEGQAKEREIQYSIGVYLPYFANIGGPSGGLEVPVMAKGGSWSSRPVQVLDHSHVLFDDIVLFVVDLLWQL